MKKAFINLIPVALYWVEFAFGALIVLIGNLQTAYWFNYLLIISIVSEIAVGCFIELKKIKWGILLIGCQLIICAVLMIFNLSDNTFIIVGNYVYSNVFPYSNNIDFLNFLKAVSSAAILIVPFFIGSFVNRHTKKTHKQKRELNS